MDKYNLNLILYCILFLSLAGYFLFILKIYIKNALKTKVVIENLKSTKYFTRVNEEFWDMLESDYIFIDDEISKKDDEIKFKLNSFLVDKKKNQPDFIKFGVFDNDIKEIWKNKKSLLRRHGLLNERKIENIQWLPYHLNFLEFWYCLFLLSVLIYGFSVESFDIPYILLSFEFLRLCLLFIKFFEIKSSKTLEVNISNFANKTTLKFLNRNSVAQIKKTIEGYCLKYISLYFNKEDNFLPLRVDVYDTPFEDESVSVMKQIIFPNENILKRGGYNEFVKELNIDFRRLKKSDIELLELNFGH